MAVGVRFYDVGGELGSASTARLGRLVYNGSLAAGASFTVPNLNFTATPPTWSGNGVLLVAQGVGGFRIWQSGLTGITWDNTTKTVTNTAGAPLNVAVILWAETTPAVGTVGVRIRNASGEVLLDNVNPALEVVAEGTVTPNKGSTFSIPQPGGYGPLITCIRWGINLDFVVMGANGNGFACFVNGGFGSPFPIDYKVLAENPTTSRGAGSGPVMALYRGSDGRCLFSSRRKYGRVRTALPLEQTGFFDGGSGGASFFYHNTVPSDCYIAVQPSYRLAGDLGMATIRASTTQLTTVLVSGITTGIASSIGIITVPSYPGAWMNSHIVLNP